MLAGATTDEQIGGLLACYSMSASTIRSVLPAMYLVSLSVPIDRARHENALPSDPLNEGGDALVQAATVVKLYLLWG